VVIKWEYWRESKIKIWLFERIEIKILNINICKLFSIFRKRSLNGMIFIYLSNIKTLWWSIRINLSYPKERDRTSFYNAKERQIHQKNARIKRK
jgi:hypothetical protein